MWGKPHTPKVSLSDFENFKGLMVSQYAAVEQHRRMDATQLATRLMEMESHMEAALNRLTVLEQSIRTLHGLGNGELCVKKRNGRLFINHVSGH